MADRVTLDDLLPLEWLDPREHGESVTGFQMCTRCGGVVYSDDRGEALAAHERWHQAIEALQAGFTITVDGVTHEITDQSLANAIVSGLVGQGRSSAPAQTEQSSDSPLRDQLIEQFRGLAVKEWGLDATDLADQVIRLVEPHMERYLKRALTAEDEYTEAVQRQWSQLRDALQVDASTDWATMLRMVADQRHPYVRELARLRDLEQWLFDQGAPRNTDELIDWLRDMFDGLRSYRQYRREVHAGMTLSQQLYELAEQSGLPVGDSLVEWMRKQLVELAAHRGIQRGEPVSPTVAGLIDAQHIELLRLAARGRRAYAEGEWPDDGPLVEGVQNLRHEADAFECAARLLEDPRRLAGLIPTSMQTWALDDDVSEIVAKATGIRVVLLDSQPDPAAEDAHQCESHCTLAAEGELHVVRP